MMAPQSLANGSLRIGMGHLLLAEWDVKIGAEAGACLLAGFRAGFAGVNKSSKIAQNNALTTCRNWVNCEHLKE
jgi:hypothetical protein